MGSLSEYFPEIPAAAAYTPAIIQYDGTSTYYSGSVAATAQQITVVGRFKILDSTNHNSILCLFGATNHAMVDIAVTDNAHPIPNKLDCIVQDTSGSTICRLSTSTNCADGSFHSFLFSYDGTAGTGTLILDGSSDIDTGSGYHTLTTGTIKTATTGQLGSPPGTWAYADALIGFVGAANSYGLDYADFFDTSNYPIQQDETTWANSGWGSQPLLWNEHGCMTNNLGSAANMTNNGAIVVAPWSAP
jgi:hypothetical protein